jgi:hypothetical protein
MFAEKITIEDLLIRVLPGGFLVVLAFFVSHIESTLNVKLDFLYSFFFICVAFIVGEVLQTVAHSMEFFVNIFFKGYKPSEIFLYKNNPVLFGENSRQKLFSSLELSDEEKKIFDKEYKSIPLISGKKSKARQISQSYFWKLYAKVEDDEKIRRSNVNYLFTRVIVVDFLVAFIYLMLSGFLNYGIVALLIFLVFMWRTRGLARGLVFKSVSIYIK